MTGNQRSPDRPCRFCTCSTLERTRAPGEARSRSARPPALAVKLVEERDAAQRRLSAQGPKRADLGRGAAAGVLQRRPRGGEPNAAALPLSRTVCVGFHTDPTRATRRRLVETGVSAAGGKRAKSAAFAGAIARLGVALWRLAPLHAAGERAAGTPEDQADVRAARGFLSGISTEAERARAARTRVSAPRKAIASAWATITASRQSQDQRASSSSGAAARPLRRLRSVRPRSCGPRAGHVGRSGVAAPG